MKIWDIPLIIGDEEFESLRKSMTDQEIKQLAFNAAANAIFNKHYELINTVEKTESEAS
jgi:hypothetical protein